MDYNNIKSLLDKYFEGESSLIEEAELKAYFNQESIDPKLKEYQSLFQFFEFEQSQSLGEDFEVELLEKIKVVDMPQTTKVFRLMPVMSRIAAAVALILVSWFAYNQLAQPEAPKQQAIDWSQYEPETPEEALKITRAALRTASVKLNGGAVKAVTEFNKIEQVGKIFK